MLTFSIVVVVAPNTGTAWAGIGVPNAIVPATIMEAAAITGLRVITTKNSPGKIIKNTMILFSSASCIDSSWD